MRDSRDELTKAIHRLFAACIAVEGHLNQPYPDDPRWTPWSRFVGPAMDRVAAVMETHKANP